MPEAVVARPLRRRSAAPVFRLWDLVVAADAGLHRFRLAARATVSLIATVLTLFLLAKLAGMGGAAALPFVLAGALIAMMGSLTVSDPTRRAQVTTLLVMPVVAWAALAVGTVLSGAGAMVGALVFSLVIFLAVYVRRFGPRGQALGMMSYMAYFTSYFLHTKLADLGLHAAAFLVATAWVAVTRFALLRERPASVFRWTARALCARVSLILDEQARAVGDPLVWSRRMGRRYAHFARLNDTALDLQGQLGLVESATDSARCAEALLDVELALGSIGGRIESVIEVPGSEGELLRGRVFVTLESARALASRCLPLDRELDAASRDETNPVGSEIRALLEALPVPSNVVLRDASETNAPAPATAGHDALRLAIQASIAVFVAMFAGKLVSPVRWYWAVIAAFVVFSNTSTRGEVLSKAWSRLLGTVIGVAGGLALASLVKGHRDVELAGMTVFFFLGLYLLRVSYAWMVLSITTLLALLYDLMGTLTTELLTLRLIETLIGSLTGALVAAFVLPARSGERVWTSAAMVLRAAAQLLDERIALRAPDCGMKWLEDVRDLDKKLRDLRAASKPYENFIGARRAPSVPVVVRDLSRLVFWMRFLLAAASHGETTAPCETGAQEVSGRNQPVPANAVVNSRATGISARARLLADVLEARSKPRTKPSSGARERAPALPAGTEAKETKKGRSDATTLPVEQPGEPRVARDSELIYWMDRLDKEMAKIGALAGTS